MPNRFRTPSPRRNTEQVVPGAPRRARVNRYASPEPKLCEPMIPDAPKKLRRTKTTYVG